MSNILGGVFRLVWRQVLLTILTLVTIMLLPNKTVVSIGLAVLTWQYLLLLFSTKPKPKQWVFTLLFTAAFFLAFGLLSWALGFAGAVGVLLAPIVIILLLVVWKLWENWALYDAVTTWGAERLRGKHKREFDLDGVVKRK